MMRTVPRLVLALALPCLAAAQGMPDLALDLQTLGKAPLYELAFFAPDACELQAADLCVGAPGGRKLLRFDVFAINQGTADLVLGVPDPTKLLPDGEPMWVFSACHNHFHFQTFARYELRRHGEPTPILTGQKRSFCVEDTKQASPTAPSAKKYCCNATCGNVQGVQVGWGDLYPSNLPCQWIDITDGVPPGAYDLCVFINTAGILPDADPTNDSGCVPVTIDAPPAGAAAPKVRIRSPHGGKKAKVGRPLRIVWKKRVRGDFKFQELWFSRDGGGTFEFVTGGPALPEKKHVYRWVVPAGAATDQARVRVVVWSKNPPDGTGPGPLQHGTGDSAVFRIVP